MLIENLIKKIKESEKESFTKDDVIKLISETYRPIITSNGVTINPESYTITVNGKEHTVAKKIFELSYYLMCNKNKMINKGKILDNVWGRDIIVNDRTIDVHIRKARIVTGEFIKTIRTQGYGWIEN